MKKLIYIFLTVLIVACSGGNDGGSDDGCPINFECSTATENDFLNLEMVTEEYQSYIASYGEPISGGLVQDEGGGFNWRWVWLNENGEEVCVTVTCSDCSYLIFSGIDGCSQPT